MESEFEEGDVVSRLTGGPLMTVEKTRRDHLVACVWFDGAGVVQRDVFAARTLQRWVLAPQRSRESMAQMIHEGREEYDATP